MKRIVIFALKGPESNGVSGGIEVYEEEFAKTLEKMGMKIEIYCGRDKHEEKLPSYEQLTDNITVRRFDSPFNFLPLSMIPMHYYYLRKGKKNTDFVIENQSVLLMGVPFYKNSILTIIHHLTGKDFIRKQGKIKGSIGYIAERFIFPKLYRNQNLLTVSEHTKNEISNVGFNSNQIKVIPPIINTKGKEYTYHSKRANIVSYIGRYTGREGNKRIDHVIEVFPQILKEIPDAKLIIAGSIKKENELKSLVQSIGIEKTVEFCGFVDEKEKAEILSSSKVLASPSYQEGFGITYIEANSFGTPIVGYEIEGLDTVSKTSGIMVKKDDKEQLAKSIISLLRDDQVWRGYSLGALENSKKYAQESIQKQLITYITSIIK